MFPEFESPRRRSRRRWIIPALLAAVVAVFLLVGNRSTESLGTNAFYDDVRSVAAQQAASSADFRSLLTNGIDMDRGQYMDLIAQLRDSLDRSREQLEPGPGEPEPSGRVAGTKRLAEAMLDRWQTGIDQFEMASLGIVDNPDNPVAVTQLGEALGELAAGDAIYEVLVEEIGVLQQELELPEADLPGASYLPTNALNPNFLGALVGRLLAAESLQGVRGVVVANIRTVPEATAGDEGGIDRLPFTETLEVQVAVANRGNVAENDVLVLLTVDDGIGNRVASEQVSIPMLDSQEQTTVIFGGIPVSGGNFYIIDVGLIAANTGSPTKLEVFVSEAAPVNETGE